MQQLKVLTFIVIFATVGVVVSFGGSLYTAYKTHEEREANTIPANQVAVPATAQ